MCTGHRRFKSALAEAFEIKKDRFKYVELGRNKTLMMISSIPVYVHASAHRSRFKSGNERNGVGHQPGCMETGNRTRVSWTRQTRHYWKPSPSLGCYCDITRSTSLFARFENRDFDYQETILNQFIQYSGRPVFSMEAATRHPLQSFADLITIEEYKKTVRPKVVMTWAPHPRPLPQAVPNSFAEWMNATDYDFVITHPEGYELAPQFVGNAKVEYDQMKAFEGADFIYAKNWAAYAGDITDRY